MSRTIGQVIANVFAILCFVAAAISAVAVWVFQAEATDAIRGSLLASVFFFVSAGTVLYVIGAARLKGLLTLDRKNDGSR